MLGLWIYMTFCCRGVERLYFPSKIKNNLHLHFMISRKNFSDNFIQAFICSVKQNNNMLYSKIKKKQNNINKHATQFICLNYSCAQFSVLSFEFYKSLSTLVHYLCNSLSLNLLLRVNHYHLNLLFWDFHHFRKRAGSANF